MRRDSPALKPVQPEQRSCTAGNILVEKQPGGAESVPGREKWRQNGHHIWQPYGRQKQERGNKEYYPLVEQRGVQPIEIFAGRLCCVARFCSGMQS